GGVGGCSQRRPGRGTVRGHGREGTRTRSDGRGLGLRSGRAGTYHSRLMVSRKRVRTTTSNGSPRRKGVAVLGATGTVGQRFIQLLEGHPCSRWRRSWPPTRAQESPTRKRSAAAGSFRPG